MLRAVYRRIKRFLAWLNREGDWSKEAANHRRDAQSRYGRHGGDWYGGDGGD